MLMSTQTMTAKQRVAFEAREAAQREGKILADYAKARGLVIRELYDGLASLRRKGVVPRSGRRARNKFVAVRVASEEALPRVSTMAVCRIVSREGYVIECVQWPPANWLAGLARNAADVAT
jgi:hypothetical protein